MKEFSADNPELDVTKLFICAGTKDIRNCHEKGVFHLKNPLQTLFTTVKERFPNAKVYIQSLLPIPLPLNGNRFSNKNFLSMNRLIFNLRSKYKLFFIDAFSIFLNRHGYRNTYLFPKFDEKRSFIIYILIAEAWVFWPDNTYIQFIQGDLIL